MENYVSFYKRASGLLQQQWPSTKNQEIDLRYLIAPLDLQLPKIILEKAQAAVTVLSNLPKNPVYYQHVAKGAGQREGAEFFETASPSLKKQNSILMAYDFHCDADGNIGLIEINTNAAGFMLAALAQQTHDMKTAETSLEKLKSAFLKEWYLAKDRTALKNVRIIDDNLGEQKMFVEFLMYKDWFEQQDLTTEIIEARAEMPKEQEDMTLIYNRSTDFLFSEESHAWLKEAYLSNRLCVTPHPREYLLLADKQRLIDLSQPEWRKQLGLSAEQDNVLNSVLLPAQDLKSFSSLDELWSERKNYMFKPKRSYGGKSVYRGSSVSRKVFDRLLQEETLAQKYFPAMNYPTKDQNSIMKDWKFDLRFYVYESEIQLSIARLYQGQVTNFSSTYGGFCPIHFT